MGRRGRPLSISFPSLPVAGRAHRVRLVESESGTTCNLDWTSCNYTAHCHKSSPRCPLYCRACFSHIAFKEMAHSAAASAHGLIQRIVLSAESCVPASARCRLWRAFGSARIGAHRVRHQFQPHQRATACLWTAAVMGAACPAYAQRQTGRAMGTLSHVGADAAPVMVDVSGKAATVREAVATARVVLPQAAWSALAAPGAIVSCSFLWQYPALARLRWWYGRLRRCFVV